MGCKISFFFFLSVLMTIISILGIECSTNTAALITKTVNISRTSFPSGFIFGVSSSAYQYEGAANEGGRGASIWDTFVHKYPEKITGGATGDVAEDQYHRYKEDVKLMKSLGMQAYRFSISWTRILPSGRAKDGRNSEGIKYYNSLINELLSHGIQPFVTLFHWDAPQMLEDEYGGFRNSKIVEDYLNYVDVCFKEFGERVKHWITLNEPYVFSVSGYGSGVSAPGRCSKAVNQNCTGGNSATEPYMVGHNLLLAHAAAVKLYRDKYQKQQKGEIGTTLSANWHLPYSNSSKDSDATQREIDFDIGWFLDPLVFGQYPKSMKSLVGQRLPKFTKEQSQQLKGSFDFVGINYYYTNYVMNNQSSNANIVSVSTDPRTTTTGIRNGIPIGPVAASPWLYVYPKGLEALMVYLKERYNSPKIYITENGYSDPNYNNTNMLEKSLKDSERTYYHSAHLSYLQQAIREGANVHGYFAWTFLDDFEWSSGYSVRFGLVYVDFNDGLKRYPKNSALWFKKFLT